MSRSNLKGVQCVGCNAIKVSRSWHWEVTRCGEVRQDGVCARHREQLDNMFKNPFINPSAPNYGVIITLKDGTKHYKLKSSNAYYKLLNSIHMNVERCYYNSQIHGHMKEFCKLSNPLIAEDDTDAKKSEVRCAQQ